jgi:hypothetical protein
LIFGWEISFVGIFVKIASLDRNLDIFKTVCRIQLAKLHQSRNCLYQSVVSFKSYGIEYFGWKTPFRSFLFIIPHSLWQILAVWPFQPNLFCGAASLGYIGLQLVELF